MRVLLAIASDRTRNDLTQALEAEGHEVITSTPRREELLRAIEEAMPVQAALVTQAALGAQWVRWLRQLRKRAPGVRTVVLLRPGAEKHWRRAMMAGAYEALGASATREDLLRALSRTLPAPVTTLLRAGAMRWDGLPAARRSGVPRAVVDLLDRRRAS